MSSDKRPAHKSNIENSKDLFAHESNNYDREASGMVRKAIAEKIAERINLTKYMHLMDFGAGTGLLTKCLAPDVGKITAADISPSMLEVFRTKSFNCEVEIIQEDLLLDDSALKGLKFDGIVSALTMHHLKDISDFLEKLFQWTRKGGFIALSDLDKEDGSFHENHMKESVHHYGFERKEMQYITECAGFQNIEIDTADVMIRDNGVFPIFLLTAKRP